MHAACGSGGPPCRHRLALQQPRSCTAPSAPARPYDTYTAPIGLPVTATACVLPFQKVSPDLMFYLFCDRSLVKAPRHAMLPQISFWKSYGMARCARASPLISQLRVSIF